MDRPDRAYTQLAVSVRQVPEWNRDKIVLAYRRVRATTDRLTDPLDVEDYVIQSMDDVSPTKWHLGHTTWFFETFILAKLIDSYQFCDSQYSYIFNSYYEALGPRHPRPKRGLLSRPTVSAVRAYRRQVDEQMQELIETADESTWGQLSDLIVLGLNHEQQHQELLLMDIKHVFANNPLRPAYCDALAPVAHELPALHWVSYPENVCEIGHQGSGFCFDNETPRHKTWVHEFELADRLISNAEYLEFIDAGGYKRAEFWLSDGWHTVQDQGWSCPLYWDNSEGRWWQMSLAGMRELVLNEPVTHVSYYEADAFARWRGCRLPGEFEWECAAQGLPLAGNFVENAIYHPVADQKSDSAPRQMFGDVWEWTQSAYSPYPGYRPALGAIGEYNGKFMCNQMVLRGGACVTPADHISASYRNFFYPHHRWQFAGIRLARDV